MQMKFFLIAKCRAARLEQFLNDDVYLSMQQSFFVDLHTTIRISTSILKR